MKGRGTDDRAAIPGRALDRPELGVAFVLIEIGHFVSSSPTIPPTDQLATTSHQH